MAAQAILCMIYLRLRQLKNWDELMVNINVTSFDDLIHLLPVRANQAFA